MGWRLDLYNIHTEMPSGAISKGYDRKTQAEAERVFQSLVTQIRAWKNFSVDVVMLNDLDDKASFIERERII